MDGRKARGSREESLVEHVRRGVLEDIIEGRLKPGSTLKVPELAERWGVSRTPAREALSLLVQEGLIMAIPYKGYLVRPIELADVNDVFLFRRLIEPAAAEIAARSLRPAELEELHRLVHESADGEHAMALESDARSHDFHRVIVAATGSPRLLSSFESVYNDVRRLQYAGIGNPRWDLVHQEHVSILDALAQGDAEAARERMAEHIDLIRVRTLSTPGR